MRQEGLYAGPSARAASFCLGFFQYGLWHFGQTLGSRLRSAAGHSWGQRSQRQYQTVFRTLYMARQYINAGHSLSMSYGTVDNGV